MRRRLVLSIVFLLLATPPVLAAPVQVEISISGMYCEGCATGIRAMLLRTEGYEVTLAADGVEGLEVYRAEPTDVVLVDIFMPRKDGIATIGELRRDFPDAVILAMSADASIDRPGALLRAREAGAHLTLRKPLEPWVLLRSLEGALAGRRSLAVSNG